MSVKRLALAIKQHESGGNYKARGADGEIGAYQIMPNNYKAWAREAGVNPNDTSPQAQDRIAQYKIGQYYEKYKDPATVAIAWNGGPGRADEYTRTGKLPNVVGVSKGGANYNVANYAKNVLANYKNAGNPYLENFAEKVEKSRKAGKTDTDILDYLESKDRELATKIRKSRSLYGQNKGVENDRDLLNYLAVKFGGRMPTVPSVPIKGSPEAIAQLPPETQARRTQLQNQLKQQQAEGANINPNRLIPQAKFGIPAIAETINKGYEKFTQLPGIKQFGQAVGNVVKGAGAVIGGAVGAVGETGIQAARALGGEGFDLKKIIDSTVTTGKETGEFGYGVGAAGAPASLLGGAGKVINGALSFGMGYSGYDELKQGIEQKDPAKIYSGLQNMVVAGFALKNVGGELKADVQRGVEAGRTSETPIKTTISETGRNLAEGSFVNPKITQQVKSDVRNVISKVFTGKTAVEASISKAADTYREVLRPDKGELKKFEVKKGQDINDLYRRMAEKDLIIEKDTNNRLDTTKARETVNEMLDTQEGNLQKVLQRRTQATIDLQQARFEAEKAIMSKKNVSAEQKASEVKELNTLYNEEVKQRRSSRSTPNRKAILEPDLLSANEIKRGLWKATPFDSTRPYRGTASYEFGNAIRDQILKKAPETKELNAEMAKDIEMRKLLENAHGRAIKGGILPRQIAGTTGAIIGQTLRIPILGGVFGKFGGEATFDYLTSPERLTTNASARIREAKQLPAPLIPSLLLKLRKLPGGLSIKDVTADIPEMEALRDSVIVGLKKLDSEDFLMGKKKQFDPDMVGERDTLLKSLEEGGTVDDLKSGMELLILLQKPSKPTSTGKPPDRKPVFTRKPLP